VHHQGQQVEPTYDKQPQEEQIFITRLIRIFDYRECQTKNFNDSPQRICHTYDVCIPILQFAHETSNKDDASGNGKWHRKDTSYR